MKRKEKKILLVYKDFDDVFQIESVWAEKMDEYYRIVNIPFFAKNVAYGDIVAVENDGGSLYFDSLIKPSGHSTIQMIINDPNELKGIGNTLVSMGCDWEESHIKGYISIDIPKNVDYTQIRKYLEEGLSQNKWDYREACLSDEHRESTK